MANVLKHTGLGGALIETAEGFTDTVEYKVTDLPDGDDASRKKVFAIHRAGIPNIGEVHISKPIVVLSKSAILIDLDKAVVTVNYGVPTQPNTPIDLLGKAQIEVGSTIQSVQTNIDAFGNPLLLEQVLGVSPGAEPDTYIATAEVGVPNAYFRFSQTEADDPGLKGLQYTGTVNAGAVAWSTVLNDPGCWLCNGITGVGENIAGPYEVFYEFLYAKPKIVDGVKFGGWDAFLVMIKEGNIPDNLVMGQGKNNFQMHPTEDFTTIPGLQT